MYGAVTFYYGGYCPIENDVEGSFRKKQINFYLDKALNIFGCNLLADQRALKRSFKKLNIDLCYAEFGPTGVALMAICDELEIPLIVNFHGYDISMEEVMEKFKDDYVELFEIAAQIVGVSVEMCQKLERLGCPKSKIKLLPCTPDPIFFGLTPNLTSKRLLSVGRFVDKKAPYLTLLAFKKVLEKFPDLELVMIGDGPLLNCCENLVRVLDITNVTFTGALSHEETREYFTKCAIFVQHSLTAKSGDKEGTPVTIMEASAIGLPVVSTFHGGIPDIIKDGETGFLVAEFDFETMAEKIIQLIGDNEIARNFSESGRAYMKQAHNPEDYKTNLNRIIVDVYQHARQNSGSR